jgi:hypothetical protein
MGMGSGLLLEDYWHYPSRGARQAHGGSRGPAGSCLAGRPATACLAMHQDQHPPYRFDHA